MAKKLPKDSRTTAQRKADMLKALEKSLGVVTTAAKSAGLNPSTHYLWLDRDSRYAKKVAEITNLAIDFAESSLFKQIQEGNTTATIFYLKTKGKERGYIERREVTGRDGRDLTPQIEITIVDPEEESNDE